MKSKSLMRKNTLFAFILLALGISACKKNKTDDAANARAASSTTQTPTGDRVDLSLDSIFLYAQQIYFWNDALPTYDAFSPRKYKASPEIDGYNRELFALTQFKINTATGKPYEYPFDPEFGLDPKYSYINDITQNNPQASANIPGIKSDVDLEGNGNDIGIRAIYYLTNNNAPRPYKLYVTAVYPGSPAEAAGVQRGWQITKVNGQTIGASYDGEENTVENALNSSSVSLEGIKYLDKTAFSLTLQKKSYKSSPVYASKVISRSGKQIGYLAYGRFSALTNFNTPSDIDLDGVFTSFNGSSVTDLIVDLRYNGGGYIESAQYLANLIAPSTTSGKKMFTEIYNSTMQSGKATILSNQPLLNAQGKVQYSNGKIYTYADQDYSTTAADNNKYFAKKGNLNGVNNIVFIVSNNTASAAELLINSLKPYMNVKLVGDTTYGKPVGFFPFVIQNRYEVFMPLFETRNANDQGGYYTGMIPDVKDQNDTPYYPFGDERDNYLAKALNLIAPAVSNGTVSSIASRIAAGPQFKSSQLKPVNPHSEFIGMVERRGGRTNK